MYLNHAITRLAYAIAPGATEPRAALAALVLMAIACVLLLAGSLTVRRRPRAATAAMLAGVAAFIAPIAYALAVGGL